MKTHSLEWYMLGWMVVKDKKKAYWECDIIRDLGDGTTKDAAYVMELIARFKLTTALEPLKKMPAGEPSWRSYLRAQAIAALDAEAGTAAFKEFYETIPIERLLAAGRFGMPSLGDSVLNRAECKAILPRLVAALESADKNQGTPVAHITLTLSRLTDYYDGYVTTAVNDAASVKLLAQRWRTWLDANDKKLAWDEKLGRFVAR